MREKDNWPLRVVAIIGMPGSGKSSVARILHSRLGWPVLTSEQIRVERFPEVASSSLDSDFTENQLRLTYATLRQRLSYLLAHRQSALIDGVFRDQKQRAMLSELAEDHNAEVKWVLLTCQPATAVIRLKGRSGGAASGPAGPKAYQKIAGEYEPVREDALTLDTTDREPVEIANAIEEALFGRKATL